MSFHILGDVIIRINSTVVHNLDHAEVVENLKACPKGQPTNFQVQRSGVLTVVKTMPGPLAGRKNHPPRPKSMPNFDDQLQFSQQPAVVKPVGVRSSSSMGIIATNGETSDNANSNTTYEARSHPQVSNAGDGYKSLKRAVQSHSRFVCFIKLSKLKYSRLKKEMHQSLERVIIS